MQPLPCSVRAAVARFGDAWAVAVMGKELFEDSARINPFRDERRDASVMAQCTSAIFHRGRAETMEQRARYGLPRPSVFPPASVRRAVLVRGDEWAVHMAGTRDERFVQAIADEANDIYTMHQCGLAIARHGRAASATARAEGWSA